MIAAERLFAERGVAAVSLRQIVAAAGHKNMSAAHYHFGSREGLLRAVFDLRMPPVDRLRRDLMDQLPAQADTRELRSYVEIFIWPLAEQLRPRPEGNYYLRFLEQYRFFPDSEEWLELAPATYAMADEMKACLSYLPPEIAQARFGSLRSLVVAALAELEHQMMAAQLDWQEMTLLVSNLIDEMAGALCAPMSAKTLHLQALQSRNSA